MRLNSSHPLPSLNDLLRTDPARDLNLPPPQQNISDPTHFAGLVAAGVAINEVNLIQAYENGIFPWPHGTESELWFSPVWRGVIDFDQLHLSRSLQKKIRKCEYSFSINRAFEEVMEFCSSVPRRGQLGSWIVPELMQSFKGLKKKGLAHSVEAWDKGELVAGIYGVCIGGSFSAESMFGLRSDSSKICLFKLIHWLRLSGFKFLDVQMITPVTEAFGGRYITRGEFLMRLKDLRSSPPQLDKSINLNS